MAHAACAMALLCLSSWTLAASDGAWNYDRCDKENGPSHWPNSDGALCGAGQQSPIDLCGALKLPNDAKYRLTFANKNTPGKLTLETDGQAKIVPTDLWRKSYTVNSADIGIKVGRQAEGATDLTWQLAQAHFHWGRAGRQDEGSEHYIEGVQHPLEIHFVHHNSKYADLTAALASGNDDALLVVGQCFEVDRTGADLHVQTDTMTTLVSGIEKEASTTEIEIAPYAMIDQSEGFYTYPGSLTTPTCNPVVTWIVMHKVAKIRSSTLDLFHDKTLDADGKKVEFGNYRDLQPKGYRTVWWSWGEAPADFAFTGRTCSPLGARQPIFRCDHDGCMAETEELDGDATWSTGAVVLACLLGVSLGLVICCHSYGIFSLLSGGPSLVHFSARTPRSSSPLDPVLSKDSPPARRLPQAPAPLMKSSSDSHRQHLGAKARGAKPALGAESGNAPQVHLSTLGSALSKLCNETHKGISSQGRRLWPAAHGKEQVHHDHVGGEHHHNHGWSHHAHHHHHAGAHHGHGHGRLHVLGGGHAHAHGRHHGMHEGDSEKMHDFFDRVPSETVGLSREESRKHDAACHIQAAAFNRVIGTRTQLKREMLLERLELELNLQRGLRLLLLCIALFVLVVYSMVIESTSPYRLGLLQTFKTVFLLDDSLAHIKTLRAFQDYIKTLNQQTRLLMPLSTQYFSERTGQVRVFEGMRSFEEPLQLNVALKVDTPEWTLTAWVQLENEGGANIIRKPLGVSNQEKDCTCWGWNVGWPNDVFEYGAHDFAGSEDHDIIQETVASPHASADDGKMHYLALIVTQEKVEMWVDAEKKFEGPLKRPVTDCSGSALEIGSPDVPNLGEITFYPHKITQTQMQEILYAGYTFEEIAEGKVPFLPPKETSDFVATKHDKSFAEAQEERAAAAKELQIEATLNRVTADLVENAATKYKEHHAEKIYVPKKTACDADADSNADAMLHMFGNDTSCHIIDTWDAKLTDTLSRNKQYYNLIPSAYWPSGFSANATDGVHNGNKDRMEIDPSYHLKPKEYPHYDPSQWKSFCGKSATFSLWLETDTVHGGAILARYSKENSTTHQSELEWALYAEGYGLCVRGRRAPSNSYVPTSYGLPLEYMKYKKRRHIAWVFDKDLDQTRTYLDGSLLGTTDHPKDTIKYLDCDEFPDYPEGRHRSGDGQEAHHNESDSQQTHHHENGNRQTRSAYTTKSTSSLSDSKAYTGLAHLAPGVWGLKGPLQDWRMYHEVLTEAELHNLAEESEDSAGVKLRSCEHETEGEDTSWTDIYGHDCSWYYDMKKTVPGVCSSAVVKAKCPEACGAKKKCYEKHEYVTTYDIWNRIMLLEDSMHHKGMGVICAREGVDLVAQCEQWKKNGQRGSSSASSVGALGYLIPADGSAYSESYMDINVTDCINLQTVVSPFCAWGASNTHMARRVSAGSSVSTTAVNWSNDMHATVKKNMGWTIEFWIRVDPRTRIPKTMEDYRANPTSMRRISFFRKVSPPRVLATLSLRSNFDDVEFTAYGNCNADTKASVAVNFPSAEPLVPGKWFKISMVYGAKNQYGKSGIKVMEGTQFAFQYMKGIDVNAWCDSADDFIQAIQLPGGVLISPIQLTLRPLTIKILQEHYYQTKRGIQVRRGPAHSDVKRMTAKVDYDRSSYNYPVVLMGPPIVLQKRRMKTMNCSTVAGKDFSEAVWNHTVSGEKCHFPYDCDDGHLLEGPGELLGCLGGEAEKFFGAHKLSGFGQDLDGWFFEFLQTIADAHVLMRLDQRRGWGAATSAYDSEEGEGRRARVPAGTGGSTAGAGSIETGSVSHTDIAGDGDDHDAYRGYAGHDLSSQEAQIFSPSDYLDVESHKLEVVITTFSPDMGIASLVRVFANIGAEVSIDYKVEHYQATEGDKLHHYEATVACCFLLSFAVLCDRITVFYSNWKHSDEGDFNLQSAVSGLVFEVFLQVVLPVIYFSMRLVMLEKSGYLVDQTVGHNGLSSIPWDSSTMPLIEKISKFLHLVEEFEHEILLEKQMSAFYYVMATAQLFRLIWQTEAHPRTALLVKTIRAGADDMLHFLVLCSIIIAGYCALAHAQFGYSRVEFRDMEASFRTLWEMMLGSMLRNGATASQTWTNDVMLLFVQLTYIAIVFLILLNFIIAIVVEAYMKVKAEIEENHTEQSIWKDCQDLIQMLVLARRRRWPGHDKLIWHLSKSTKTNVGYRELRLLFPDWRDKSGLTSMIEFYGGFDFLGPDFKGDDEDDMAEVKQHVTNELSIMLGVAKPTPLERILEDKRLNIIAVHEREHRKHAQKATQTFNPELHTEASFITRVRREKKKQRLLSIPIPSTVMIRDEQVRTESKAQSGKSISDLRRADSPTIGSMTMDHISDVLDEITPLDEAAEGASTLRPVEFMH